MFLQVMSPPESADTVSGRRDQEKEERGVSEDTDFVLTTTRDRHFEKEDITSYVNRKREMFLVQYALGVKREEIQKLEDIARVTPLSVCIGPERLHRQRTQHSHFQLHIFEKKFSCLGWDCVYFICYKKQ